MAKLEPAARAEEHASHMKLLENALKVGAAPLIARARAQLSPRAAGAVPQGARNQLAEQSRLLGDTQQRVRRQRCCVSHAHLASPPAQHAHVACACSTHMRTVCQRQRARCGGACLRAVEEWRVEDGWAGGWVRSSTA